MASQESAEEHCNTENEEGTIAIQKKRARRVSFAENTSVHIFDRDEEFETPPDSTNPSSFSEFEKSGEELGFIVADAVEVNDSSQNEEEEDFEEYIDEFGSKSPFLRPPSAGSPSPGSTFGSATSNDEDNFFGPVSSSFIRPPRFSDSGASDGNHDLTMDSTAFSMHFRSIARSESEGDLKTSTGVQLPFEEKTPSSDSIPSTRGSSMVLTDEKRPNNQSSTHISKLNDGCDSNDMSLVGEYLHRYDYARLSPGLDALLAEGSKDLHVVSNSNDPNDLEPSLNRKMKLSLSKENEIGPMDLCHNHNKDIKVTEADSFVPNGFNQANVGSISPSRKMPSSFSSTTPKVGGLTTSSPQNLVGTPNGKRNEPLNDASHWRSDASNTLNPSDLAPQVDAFTAQENHNPLPGSTTSLSAKRRRVLLTTGSPSQSQWNETPSEKQTSAFVRTENIAHAQSTSSILKSISKLKILEASPFSPALNAKFKDSSLRSSENFFKSTSLATLLEKNSKVPQVNDASYNVNESHAPDVSYEGPLSNVNQKRREKGQLMNIDDCGTETPKRVRVGPLSALPSQFIWSGEKIQSSLLTSENPTEGNLNIARDEGIASPQKLILSPLKRLNMLKSPKYEISPLRDQSLSICTVGVIDSSNNVISTNCSINSADKPDSISNGTNEASRLLNIGISTEVKEVDNGALTIVQDELGTIWNMANTVKNKVSENCRSVSANRDLQAGRVLAEFGNGMLDEGIKVASLVLHGSADNPSFQKNLLDQFCQSPLKGMPHRTSPNDHIHHLPEVDVQSPGPNLLTNGDVNSSEKKQRSKDAKFRNVDHMDEFTGTERTPNLQKGRVSLDKVNNGPYMNSHKKHMAEISMKFLDDTKELLPASADNLNFRAIDMVEDILCQLQRSKAYEMLCNNIESQKSFDHSSDLVHKREAEMKLLMHKFVYKQVKLQLMRVKRDRLQKRIQLVKAGIQESELVKSDCLPHTSRDIQVEKDDRFKSSRGNVQENKEASCDEGNARQLVVEESEQRIYELTKAFHISLNLKGEPSPAETVVLANNHLIKRACLRLVRMEAQLWVVDNLESKNGHHSVELNYHDLIIQRLTITVNPVSNIHVSNKLNEASIIRNFADMDAYTAFQFVFNAEIIRKYVGAPNLAKHTQMSSSVLGNLLDVLQEIQLSRIELQNLTHTSFCSPSVEHLDLQLCFFDYKHGKKTTMTLDMSCLKSGIYPSEILPRTETLLPQITATVQNLKPGFMRIIRLCRCISQLIT